MDKLVKHSWGRFGVTAQEVLGELGSRGIGLSSLLAIGGAQAKGALGFFTALKLLDQANPSQGEQLMLPIDACDEYLTALSGDGTPSVTTGCRPPPHPEREVVLLSDRDQVLRDGLAQRIAAAGRRSLARGSGRATRFHQRGASRIVEHSVQGTLECGLCRTR